MNNNSINRTRKEHQTIKTTKRTIEAAIEQERIPTKRTATKNKNDNNLIIYLELYFRALRVESRTEVAS